jgi:uncharacterized RDD family membrane protein YckC
MQKQIVYPNLAPRVFALAIDLLIILAFILPLVTWTTSQFLLAHNFQDFFYAHQVDTSSFEAMMAATKTPEFAETLTLSKILIHLLSGLALNIGAMGLYFVVFWRKFCTTPGKFVMRMKIVDADSYSTPSTPSLIKRFFGYLLLPFSIISIPFNRSRRAIHDRMANTVVIKC